MSRSRKAGVIAGVVVLALAIGLLLLHTAPARRYALATLHSILLSSGIDLSASSMDISLAQRSITLHNVVVRSTRAPDLPPLAESERVHLQVAVLPLLRGNTRITDGDVRNPRLHVVMTAAGKSNIPSSQNQQQSSSSSSFHIDNLKITGASLLFEDQKQHFAVELPRWNARIQGASGDAEQLVLNTEAEGQANYEGRTIAVRGISLDGVLGANSAEVHKLDLGLGDSQFSLAGRVNDLTHPALDLHADANVSVGGIAQFAGLKQRIEGRLSMQMAASGPASAPVADMTLRGNDLRVEEFRGINVSADARYNGDVRRLRLTTLDLASSAGGLHATGEMALTADAGQSTLQVQLHALNLQQVTALLDSKLKIASVATGAIRAAWPGMDFRHADGHAALHLVRLRGRPAKNVLPLDGDLVAVVRAGQITVSLGGQPAPAALVGWLPPPPPAARDVVPYGAARIVPAAYRITDVGRVSGMTVTLGGNPSIASSLLWAFFRAAQAPASNTQALQTLATLLRGQISVGADKRLSGTLKAHITDMREFLARLNELQGGHGPLVDTTVEGAADITAVLGGTTDAPRADLQVSAPALRIGRLTGVGIGVSALFEPARLTIRHANVRWRDESAVITGTVGLKGKNPPLNLDAQISGVTLEAVMAGMDKANAQAHGAFSIAAHVRGTTKAPVANLTVRGTELALYGEPLGTLNADAQLQGNVLRVTRLQMLNPGLGRLLPGGQFLSATATYNLNTKAYSLDASASHFKVQHLALPNGKTIRGDFNFTARSSGTLDNPGLNARANITGLQVDQNRLGTVAAVINVANQLAHIQLQAPEFNLTTVASIATRPPYATRFTLQAANLDLGPLPIRVPGGLSGMFSGRAEGVLELKNPEAGRVTAEIQTLNVNYRGQAIRALQPIVARYNNRVLNVQPTTIVAGASRLQIGGQIPLQAGLAPADMRIAGKFDLAGLRQFVPSLAQADTRGLLTLDLTLRGSLRALQPQGTISLRDGFFKTATLPAPVQAANFEAQIGNGVLALRDLSARFASATLRANGAIPLALLPAKLPIAAPPVAAPARFTADFAGLDLATIPTIPSDVKGLLSLHFEAQAPRPQVNALSALLRFDQLQLSLSGVPIAQQGASSVVVQNGVARVQQFRLAGAETALELAGSAGLAAPHALDLTLRGNTNAALASVFTSGVKLTGPIQIQLALTGTAQAPQAQGFLAMQNGAAAMEEPKVALSALNLRLNLAGNRLDIAQLNGNLNGGMLNGGGGFNFGKDGLSNVGVQVNAKNFALDYPEGLRTLSDVTLDLKSQGDHYVLGGNVNVQEGAFRRYVNMETEVLSYLQGAGPALSPVQQPGFLSRLRFNLPLKTQTPLLIENNVAKAAIAADLRLLGSYYSPSVTGRVELMEAGQLFFNGKTFYVQRGVVNFVNAARIEPLVDLTAQTQTAGYTITMTVSGQAGKLNTTLVSDPPLAQPDIISVLVFGRPLQDIRNAELNVAEQQAFFYVAGGLGSALSNQIQSATGISEVRVDPSLVAGEATPGARLTVGQKLTRALKVIYSMDLIDPNDRIWIGQYDITRRFISQVTRQSDNSYRFDLRREQSFGGTPLFQLNQLPQRKVQAVNVTGDSGIYNPRQLVQRLKLKPGKTYDFFKATKGVDNIQGNYHKHGYLESQARLSTRHYDHTVDVNLNVNAGPSVLFAFEGWDVSGRVRRNIRKLWAEGVFDVQRAIDSANLIRSELIKQGYLEALVKYYVTLPRPGQKNVSFDIIPGRRFAEVRTIYEGAQHVSGEDLAEQLKKAHVQDQLLTDPERVRRVLQTYLQNGGYLTAKVTDPFVRVDQAGAGAIVVPVHEGPLYRIARVQFTGNRVFSAAKLQNVTGFNLHDVYKPEMRNPALIKIQNLYWDDGYSDMVVTFAASPDPKNAAVTLNFNITEGKQSVVQRIAVRGNDQTDQRMIKSDLDLKPSQPAANDKIATSRANLYSTGAFDLVEIKRQPIADAPGVGPDKQAVELQIRVHEVRPWRWLYGGYYDTDRGPGVISDISNTNTLGDARALGLLARYDGDFQEGRLYFSQPFLRKFPYISTGSAYYVRNSHSVFVDDHIGMSLQQGRKFRHRWVLDYSYSLERARIFNLTSTVIAAGPSSAAPNSSPTVSVPGVSALPTATGGGFQGPCPPGSTPTSNPNVPGGCASVFTTPIPPHGSLTTRIAPITGTLTRDTRDDVLDATHGQMFSQGFAAGFGFIGSQQHYLKYLGQYYRFIPLGKAVPEPFKSNIKRPRLVYAGAVRLGLAGGLGGQPLIASERFFAGGGTTVRGFKQFELGPKDPNGIPIGGNAEFIINNEIRFPLKWIFDGAGFVDLGNVYPLASDFRPWDLRKTAGGGLRLRTPYFLIRADYGFKLDRQPGESSGAFFFSIGQAF